MPQAAPVPARGPWQRWRRMTTRHPYCARPLRPARNLRSRRSPRPRRTWRSKHLPHPRWSRRSTHLPHLRHRMPLRYHPMGWLSPGRGPGGATCRLFRLWQHARGRSRPGLDPAHRRRRCRVLEVLTARAAVRAVCRAIPGEVMRRVTRHGDARDVPGPDCRARWESGSGGGRGPGTGAREAWGTVDYGQGRSLYALCYRRHRLSRRLHRHFLSPCRDRCRHRHDHHCCCHHRPPSPAGKG